jgi:amino acid transporter
MGYKGNKFGAFKGVFTPSILTILGVIMYLRLPWIVGQAGLWATLGIILVAHIISATTGLSVASIATDKKVETGGTYYMISRSLGLPIGGTLGLALFVGLSFSVSLYLIGFAETFLTAFGFETTINAIRLTGAITLLVVTIITFISTNLALKMQFVILAILVLSILSIVLGKHDLSPQSALSGSATNALPWIALFAIFFPAVTGFEAGVSMSGDLAKPKKSIPIGTISAILVGLVIYIGLAFFFSYTVERNALINDSGILLNISLYSPLVVAGVWGATLSSAFGSILGAPRILQATAMDRITPKLFANGVGPGNEPRNALLLTFLIALSGILIGELNVIARVVSIFFIITYGFLNLTCAIENWAGSDFRPSFRIPAWISIIGAVACFIVMIQLDLAAMVGATILLGSIFLLLKRKELRLQSGDTWGGIWSSLVKYGLFKLSSATAKNQRNWTPNIILFSGGSNARPHLIDMGRTLVGRKGVFTNFELIEKAGDSSIFDKPATVGLEVDHKGKSIITRQHFCSDIYEGMKLISRVYGFTGFEPNTILMGWARKTANPKKFYETVSVLHKLDYNLVIYSHKEPVENQKKKRIDIWWKGNSRNLNFGFGLLKFITTDSQWRGIPVRINIINYNSAKTDSIYALVNQALENSRLMGTVNVINNAVEKFPEIEIIKRESADASIAMVELNKKFCRDNESWVSYVNSITDFSIPILAIEASSNFENINAFTVPEAKNISASQTDSSGRVSFVSKIKLPSKELLANEIKQIANNFENIHNDFISNSVFYVQSEVVGFHNEIAGLSTRVFSILEKDFDKEKQTSKFFVYKNLSDYSFQTKSRIAEFVNHQLVDSYKSIANAYGIYSDKERGYLKNLPEKFLINFLKPEFQVRQNDSLQIRRLKFFGKVKAFFLGWPITKRIDIAASAKLFLSDTHLTDFADFFNQFGLSSIRYLSNLRKILIDHSRFIEGCAAKESISIEEVLKAKEDFENSFNEVLNDFISSNQQNINSLSSNFEQGIQQLCFVVEKPESQLLLKPYKKIVKRRRISESDIAREPEVWFENIKLYSTKIIADFTLLSLRYRFEIKIGRQVDELNQWTSNNLFKSYSNARILLGQISVSSDGIEPNTLVENMGKIGEPSMQNRFEELFKEVNAVVNDLPEEVAVNADNFFNDLEKGVFQQTEPRLIKLRKNVQYYVGIELISKARTEMEIVSDLLRNASKRLRDKLRLAAFNLENIIVQEEGHIKGASSSPIEQREKLISELLSDLKTEEMQVRQTLEDFDLKLKKYIKASLEPLHHMVHSKISNDQKERSSRKGLKTFDWFTKRGRSVRQFLNSTLVRILYSQSEGIMLAQRLTTFEKEHKLSNQAVQELLVSLSSNMDVIKKVPFYYTNLFSGSTTLSEDLWIERPLEQQIAEKVSTRFLRGYSGALLITGERNSGKTTLSKYIANKYFPKHSVHSLKAPIGGSSDPEHFTQALKKALSVQVNPYFYLNSSPQKRVFIINDLELWWERVETGLSVVREIVSFIETYGSKYFIIVNCGKISYQLIRKVVEIDSSFMGRIECQTFDAKDIKELIIARHKTGGLKVVLDGRKEEDLTEWNFARLFNKYFSISEGNPGYCLQLWLSNITGIAGKTIFIKPPTSPNSNLLNDISEEFLMVIMQLFLHRRTSPDRLARVLRISEEQTILLLRSMQRASLVEERFTNVYAVNSYLEPYLMGQLKEKGLC